MQQVKQACAIWFRPMDQTTLLAQMMPDLQANCLDFDTFDTATPRAVSLQLGDSCPQTFLLS